MQITLNGQPRLATDDISLTELVHQVSDRVTGIAVALNSEVVPRGSWDSTVLSAGDRVDVVTAVQGG
ncbi:MAG: sulfur carrier protein ThiS [Actinomycetota bacterium]|nr:sulfur carrier protein ThiS [Actinomycetota bacterium]